MERRIREWKRRTPNMSRKRIRTTLKEEKSVGERVERAKTIQRNVSSQSLETNQR